MNSRRRCSVSMNFAVETLDAPRDTFSELRKLFEAVVVVVVIEEEEEVVVVIEEEFFGTFDEVEEFLGTFAIEFFPAVPFGFIGVDGFFGGSFAAGSRFETPFDGFICTFADTRADGADGTAGTDGTDGTRGDVRATDFRGGTTALAGVSCVLGAVRRRTLNRGFTTRCLIAVRGGGDSSLTTTESSSVLLRIKEGEDSSKMVSCDNTEISAGWTA